MGPDHVTERKAATRDASRLRALLQREDARALLHRERSPPLLARSLHRLDDGAHVALRGRSEQVVRVDRALLKRWREGHERARRPRERHAHRRQVARHLKLRGRDKASGERARVPKGRLRLYGRHHQASDRGSVAPIRRGHRLEERGHVVRHAQRRHREVEQRGCEEGPHPVGIRRGGRGHIHHRAAKNARRGLHIDARSAARRVLYARMLRQLREGAPCGAGPAG